MLIKKFNFVTVALLFSILCANILFADTIPNAFTFADRTDVELNMEYKSNSITVSGIDEATPISIAGGTYSIDGGAYTSVSGTVVNGNTVKVRKMSAAAYSTTKNVTLTIGGVSDTFSVTTFAEDKIPDPFTITDRTNVALSTEYKSNAITVAGINSVTPISISSGKYSINGGAYTSVSGTVTIGNTIKVRKMSASTYSTTKSATLTIGGVSDTFSVTTLSANTPTITGVTGTIATGQTITITGSKMVNENYTNWIQNDDFSGPVLDQTYFTNATGAVDDYGWLTTVDGSNTASYDSIMKVVGNQSVKLVEKNSSCIDAQSCGQVNLYSSITDGIQYPNTASRLPGVFYWAAYVKFNGTFSDYGQKFFLTVGGNDQYYMQPRCNGDGTATGWLLKSGGYSNCSLVFGGDCVANSTGSFTWSTNEWHYIEAEIDSVNYAGDRFTIWVDGVQDVQWTGAGHSPSEPMYNELGVPNWNGQETLVVPFTMWINRYVFSSSRIYPAAKIEVGNNSTYGSGNEKWQEPVYLTDECIQVKLDLTGLGSGPYYIWVTNNRQQRSTAYVR